MATSPSPVDPEEAGRRLIRVEEEIHSLLQADHIEPDEIDEKISKQDELVEQIISQVEDSSPSVRFKELLNKFRSLREETEELFKQRMNEIKREIESLDNSGKLIKHYMQGERRDEEVISRRFDENV